MPDPILCHDCGHDIDDHQTFETAESRDFPCRVPPCECWNEPSTIARAYAEERWLDGVDVGYALGRFHSKRDEDGHRE